MWALWDVLLVDYSKEVPLLLVILSEQLCDGAVMVRVIF